MNQDQIDRFNKEIARYEELKKSAKNEDELFHINFMIFILKGSMRYAKEKENK